MFSFKTSLKRSKTICARLVESRLPGDDFINLENNSGKGLKYINGPENHKEKLLNAFDRVTDIPERIDRE